MFDFCSYAVLLTEVVGNVLPWIDHQNIDAVTKNTIHYIFVLFLNEKKTKIGFGCCFWKKNSDC
jgi:hypothetical protein